jgi:superfamily II DNA/RNA helicase
LQKHNFSAGALHGDLAQSVRFATLEKFKANEIRLLVCSDVAARGIDIGGLSHVFNFDVPHHAEDYVHRIGRTGRAGKEGRAFTIATPDDRLAVEAIEKLIAAPIPRIEIPGLDIVEWAEGDGRRGRGRGPKGKPAPKSKGFTREAAKPKEEEARAPRAARPTLERKREAPKREEPVAPREAAKRHEPRVTQEPRHASDGPNVTGFGPDIPAFMLIRKRGPSSITLDEPSDIEEDDVSHEKAA